MGTILLAQGTGIPRQVLDMERAAHLSLSAGLPIYKSPLGK